MPRVVRPSRDDFRSLAGAAPRRAGVARGARRPRDAGLGVREAGRRRPRWAPRLPARVGRARRALGTLLVPRARPGAHARRAGTPRRRRGRRRTRGRAARPGRARRARSAARARTTRRSSTTSRRSTGASSATSATTSCARSSISPPCPPDDLGLPDAVLSLTGHVTAFDHLRQRLYLIENVFLDAEPDVDARLRRRRGAPRRARRRPGPAAAVRAVATAGRPARRRTRRCARRCRRRQYRDAVEVAREYILAGDIFQVVLAQRFDLEDPVDPFDVYRVLRQVNPSPYMYLVRHPEPSPSSARRPSRWCRSSTAG